jgi:hypothetical protein
MKEKTSESDIAKLKLSFDRHKAEPHLPIDAHVQSRSIELGRAIEKRRAIYLDQRYWIIIRDVAINRRSDSASVELANVLADLVREGTIFCPISECVFLELLKQRDLETRRSTAKIIDKLSLGVTLAPEKLRVGSEIAHLLYSHGKQDSVYPLRWLVWSKLSYVLGVIHPINTAFGPEQELVIQKAFFDRMWDISLVEMVDLLGDSPVPPNNFDALAERLNKELGLHANEIRSYKQAYIAEIGGAVRFYIGVVRQILEGMYQKASGIAPKLTETQRQGQERELINFFVQAFSRSPIAKTKLPTLHIPASCAAAIRWDKKRLLEGNDLFDFYHAAAALGYCDIFLTEKPLQSMLTANHIALDKLFGCKVISAVSEAIDCLRQNGG